MRRFLCVLALLLSPTVALAAETAAPTVQLHVLDCGYIRSAPSVTAYFGVTIADVGGTADMPVACYLIRHNADWMLFDAGNGDWRAPIPAETFAGMTYEVPRTLAAQLQALGLKPDDIGRVAVSHAHLDHVGNLALFTKANVLIQRKELEAAIADPPFFSPASAILRLTRPGVTALEGDTDVFGDGTVTLLATPGHTPGHQSLMVRLKNTGTVILTGDLYHYRAELTLRKLPPHEVSSGTAESRARIEVLAAREQAQIWIEHDLGAFTAARKAPAFYD